MCGGARAPTQVRPPLSVVSAFSSPLLAPGLVWRPSFRGRRCYTHLPPGVLALGVLHLGFGCFCFRFSFWDHYDFTSTGRLSYRQCAQYCVRHARARREAGDCRGVRAASPWDCAACTCTLHVLCAVCRQTGQLALLRQRREAVRWLQFVDTPHVPAARVRQGPCQPTL